MAAYFVDSSALVKRYVQEVGTAWVRGLTHRGTWVPETPYLTLRPWVPGDTYLTPRPSLGPRFLPSQDPAQLLFERRQKRLFSQWSAGMLVGTQEFDVLFSNDPGEEAASLGGQLEPGSDPHQN